MKNFIKRALQVDEVKRVTPQWHPYVKAQVSDDPKLPSGIYGDRREYHMRVTAGAFITASWNESGSALQRLQKMIHHEVYGDLIERLNDVRMAVYDQNSEAAMAALDKIDEYIRG